jgi:muconolactone delta-isomerase
MKILALESEKDISKQESFQQFGKEEAMRVWELYQQGTIREIYFRTDRNAAVLVLESTDVEDAQQVLATLPFVREKLIAFDLIPLVAYPGFARLFK